MSLIDLSDLPLFPEEEGVTPEADAAAASDSAIDATTPAPVEVAPPVPFGRTPLFDFTTGRMVRVGSRRTTLPFTTGPEVVPGDDVLTGPIPDSVDPGEIVWVTGIEALKQWCLMAIYSARFAHPVFSEQFGMEEPESPLGELIDVAEFVSDWGARLTEALLVHERIAAVENIDATFDPDQQLISFAFEIVTDEEERVAVEPVTLTLGDDRA